MNYFNSRKVGQLPATLLVGLVVAVTMGIGTTINFLSSGGKNPIRLLQFVSSGLFGGDAFADENKLFMTWMGMFLHFFVSWGWAILYFILYNKITSLVKNKWRSGICFGLLIWMMMALVVMPLSKAPHVSFEFTGALFDIVIIIVGAGLPIALLTNRYFKS